MKKHTIECAKNNRLIWMLFSLMAFFSVVEIGSIWSTAIPAVISCFLFFRLLFIRIFIIDKDK